MDAGISNSWNITRSNKKMKILVIRPSESFSGTEKYNELLLNYLNKRKNFSITLITNNKLFSNILSEKGVNTIYQKWLPEEVGTKKQLLKILFSIFILIIKYLILITKIEKKGKYDVICLQSRTEMIFLSPIFKLLKYKVVWVQHGALFKTRTAQIIKWLYIYSSHFTDKIIAATEDTSNDLFKNGIRKNKLKVLYIGVEIPLITKRKFKNKLILGYLGTITKEKGLKDIIEISKRLTNKIIVIGDGPDLKWMKKKIRKLKKDDQFEFTGFVLNPGKVLLRIDILIFPTYHYEATSLAIQESMSYGIPVLTYDIGGLKEVVQQNINGYLYKIGDVTKMTNDIENLQMNRSKLRSLSNNARNLTSKNFNIEIQVGKFINFFTSL